MKKIWRILVVFILALIVFLIIVFWIFLYDVSAGSIYVEYEPGDEKTDNFAEDLILELQKRVGIIYQFVGDYKINVYLGAFPDLEKGETKSVIGIFIDEEKKSVFNFRKETKI